MSLVSHAKKELDLVFGDDPDLVMCYIEVVSAFQAKAAERLDPDILAALFKRHHVAPISNDPREWYTEGKGTWTNLRDHRVMSDDGGRTYWIVPEDEDIPEGDLKRHISADKKEASS